MADRRSYVQLKQLRKLKPIKNSGVNGIRNHELRQRYHSNHTYTYSIQAYEYDS